MPTIPIRSGGDKGGIIWDTPPHELPPNAWSRGRNVRFFKNRLERLGGYRQTYSLTPGTGRALWGIWRNGVRELLLITDTQMLISADGTTFPIDVTPAVMTDVTDWIVTQYGDWVILTSSGAEPLVLDPQGAQFVPFTNWPATYRAHKITAFKNILVAVGVEISGTSQGGLVVWSDTVDPADLISVEWLPTLTNNAGDNVLPSSDGLILDFGVLRDTGVLYTDNSVWRMDPSAARPQGVSEVWRFRQIFADDGILDERCWTEVEGFHYVVGKHDIYRHDGHQRVSISDDRATELFYSLLGTTPLQIAYVEHFIEKQEIIIAFASGANTYASDALVYSYLYDAWTALSIDAAEGGASGAFSHVTRGPVVGTGPTTWGDLVGTTWGQLANTAWASFYPAAVDLELYGLAPDLGGVYVFNQSPDNSDFNPDLFLERTDLDLDEFLKTVRRLKYWSRTIPLIDGQGEVRFQFGGRDQLGASIQWGPEIPYQIGTDWKVDHRTTYRYLAIRVIQDQALSSMTMTGADLEVASSHGR